MDLRQTLTDMARAIVDSPDQVAVEQETEENGDITLILTVAPDDAGMVIGRHGRIAKALRAVIKAAAMKENKRVSVEIR